jgi:hypothetical protein
LEGKTKERSAKEARAYLLREGLAHLASADLRINPTAFAMGSHVRVISNALRGCATLGSALATIPQRSLATLTQMQTAGSVMPHYAGEITSARIKPARIKVAFATIPTRGSFSYSA